MSILLQRQRIPVHHDLKRLIVIAVGIGLCAIGWNAVLPWLELSTARSSLGLVTRSVLVDAVVRARYAATAYEPELVQAMGGRTGRWVGATWPVRTGAGDRSDAFRRLNLWAVADETLAVRGTVASEVACGPPFSDAGDWDGDGALEVITQDTSMWLAVRPSTVRVAVLRLRSTHNELVGIIGLKQSLTPPGRSSPRAVLRPELADLGSDAHAELRAYDLTFTRQPNGQWGTVGRQREDVGIEWTAPGGVLRPRRLPEDGSVTLWTPPGGTPITFAPDTPIEEVLRIYAPGADLQP